jgi:hypothetical protein
VIFGSGDVSSESFVVSSDNAGRLGRLAGSLLPANGFQVKNYALENPDQFKFRKTGILDAIFPFRLCDNNRFLAHNCPLPELLLKEPACISISSKIRFSASFFGCESEASLSSAFLKYI